LLYALGGQSDLVCLRTADGNKVWGSNLRKDLDGQLMSGWGYSESPLVDGDKLICTPGGPRGTLAALDKKTGRVVSRSKGVPDRAASSSPSVAELGGVRMIVQVAGQAVAGVAAADGKLLWRQPQGGFRTAVVPTAIFHDGYVYATAGYG